jgi:hypothetical protein
MYSMRFLLAAFFAFCFAADSGAAMWAENDYAAGSNGLKKESLTLFDNLAPRFSAGLNASFYSDSAVYKERIWAFRAPLAYTGDEFFFSLKPFLYPVSGNTRSGAGGAKLNVMTALNDDEVSYLHLTLSGAWAQQRALTTDSPGRKTFSQAAGEALLEKSFFGQFFFQVSAAGFNNPSGVSNRTLIRPVLDQSDLAYLGTFRQVTALPEWTAGAQMARDMRPDYDSHLYAGYSKISYRGGMVADSGIAGIKISLTETSTLDLAYNLYKEDSSAWTNYYKFFLQVVF